MSSRRLVIWTLSTVFGTAMIVAPTGPLGFSQTSQGAAVERPLARWRFVDQQARRAYRARDYSEYRVQLLQLLQIASGYPDVVYRLAGAEARLGHTSAALRWLDEFAATGLVRDVRGDSDLLSLPSLRESPEFSSLANRVALNNAPVSRADTVAALPDPELLAEDLTYDPVQRVFYVSSVRERKIVAVDAAGHVTDFIRRGQDGVWSILAVSVDSIRRILWATTSATPMALEYDAADSGRSALLEYDLHTARLLRRYDPPDALRNHALGDMTVGPNGDVYVSDGRAGILYVVRHGRGKLEQLVGPAVFTSPQTPTVTPDGRHVFVADYLRGIARVDVATGHTEWLAHSNSVAVNGIDGLYLAGHMLLAIQNGTTPKRVVRLDLDASLSRIQGWDAIESNSSGLGDPTHGVIVGSHFYFLANSGWDRFADDGTLKWGVRATAPVIRSLPISTSRRALKPYRFRHAGPPP